jgi:hypothetical protein
MKHVFALHKFFRIFVPVQKREIAVETFIVYMGWDLLLVFFHTEGRGGAYILSG